MAMKYFQKQRLLKLADFLEALPRGRFDLDFIAKKNNKGEQPAVNTCGTVACAIGWTPVVFPKHCGYTKICMYGTDKDLAVYSKECPELKDFYFAEEFFGLDNKEAFYLFMPESYPEGRRGKSSVANRIRKFVAGEVPRSKIEEVYGW